MLASLGRDTDTIMLLSGPLPLTDGVQLLDMSLRPLAALPTEDSCKSFLFDDSLELKVPVAQEVASMFHVSSVARALQGSYMI